MATAVHDVSDGGLLVALAEMAMASGIGAVLEGPTDIAAHAFWFGEDQARYVVTAPHAGRHRTTRTGGVRAAASGSAPPAAACLPSPTRVRCRSPSLRTAMRLGCRAIWRAEFRYRGAAAPTA